MYYERIILHYLLCPHSLFNEYVTIDNYNLTHNLELLMKKIRVIFDVSDLVCWRCPEILIHIGY